MAGNLCGAEKQSACFLSLKRNYGRRRFDAGFTMGLLHKDVSIALELGRETATPAPVSALCKELITAALAMLGSDADHTEMTRVLERLAGEELGAQK